jgi:uncharacterized protein YbaP (TraB family)
MRLLRTLLASIVLLLSLPALADTLDSDPAGKTFMWKVEKGETTLYLLGSIHALREDAYPLPTAIESAFGEAEVVIFEIDVDDMTKAAINMMTAGSLEEGRTLEEVVGPETWFEFKVHVSPSGLDPSFFSGMKPWMAALTLAAFELTKNGYLATAGLDTYLSQRADETGKERLALETADFQVSLFADLTPDQSLAFLRYTVADLEAMIPEMEQLYLDWRSGNVEPMEELLFEGYEEFPGVFKKMVVDRNRAWMPRIVELLEGDRDAMVVVGSMHLVGGEGLVALLRQQGYTVTQR